MDLGFSRQQEDLLDMVERVLSDHAGATKARRCREAGRVDVDLAGHLAKVGLKELFASTDGGLIDQVLAVESAGRHVAQVHLAGMFVGAKLDLSAWVVVPLRSPDLPVRLPGSVEAVVSPQEEGVGVRPVLSATISRQGWGDAWGSVELGAIEPLDAAWHQIMTWYQISLVAEGLGAAQGAFDLTIPYLVQREQFGAPLAGRQVVRHRLVELHSGLLAARLLLLEAAWAQSTAPGNVAMAATEFVTVAHRLIPDLQRFTGAMGFSAEYDLHLFTGRLRSVVAELGSPDKLAKAAFHAAQKRDLQ